MRLQVKGRNLEVSEQIRKYAEDKLGKLDRLVSDPTRVELELLVEKNPSISDNHVAEATVWTKGPVLRARESSSDIKASIDQLVDKLERQVKRYREKRREAPRRHAPPSAEAPPVELDDTATAITKTKQFTVNPMTPDEAVLQLELVGHDFFVFRNAESNGINVVYRRRDGHYGLIEPQQLGFFKRERPIHEQLAEEAGLDIDGLDDELAAGAGATGESLRTRVPMPSDLLAVHGIPREPEWDAVASAQAPDLPGEDLEYVALADGTLVVDEDVPDESLSPLAEALEGQISPPYHGYAFWQQDDVWAVAAKRVQIVEVPEDVPGDEVELAVNGGARSTVVDGEESGAEIPSLETFAAQQFGSFVLRANRLDDLLWEVTVIPL